MRIKINQIFAVDLGGFYGFCIRIKSDLYGFFDYFCSEIVDIEILQDIKVNFAISVDNTINNKPNWKPIGSSDLFSTFPDPKSCRRSLLTNKLEIYYDGRFYPATADQCENLEVVMIWNPEAVEERLKYLRDGQDSPILSRNKAMIRGEVFS